MRFVGNEEIGSSLCSRDSTHISIDSILFNKPTRQICLVLPEV